MKTLKIERYEIQRQAGLDALGKRNNPALLPTPKIDLARMALARKGVVNHWTLTYRRGPEGFFVFRNPGNPGVAPLP